MIFLPPREKLGQVFTLQIQDLDHQFLKRGYPGENDVGREIIAVIDEI